MFKLFYSSVFKPIILETQEEVDAYIKMMDAIGQDPPRVIDCSNKYLKASD